MKVGSYLAMMRELPLTRLHDLTSGLRFVVLSPHPDDETLGTGGLIAAARSQGQAVDVIVLTDGSESHPASKKYPRQRLIDLRSEELAKAAAILGLPIARLHHLGLEDTKAPRVGILFDQTVAQIEGIIARQGVKTLFVPWELDPHCDHEAASMVGQELRRKIPDLRLWAYPIWGWHLELTAEIGPAQPLGGRVDISQWQPIKRAAIAAHASQMTDLIDDDPDGFRFTETTLAPFLELLSIFLRCRDESRSDDVSPFLF